MLVNNIQFNWEKCGMGLNCMFCPNNHQCLKKGVNGDHPARMTCESCLFLETGHDSNHSYHLMENLFAKRMGKYTRSDFYGTSLFSVHFCKGSILSLPAHMIPAFSSVNSCLLRIFFWGVGEVLYTCGWHSK